MRTPFGWTLTAQVLCASCALWCAPAAALAALEQITPMPAVSTPAPAAATSMATNSTAPGSVDASFDRRVLTLLAMGCLVGMITGWVSGGPRETGFRLLNKPRKTRVSVLVPPGPAPRLIPSDSPNATRARWTRAPVSRQTPASVTRSGVIDYIAVFADSAEASEAGRVDYLLIPGDSEEESVDPPDELDGPAHR